ncbi:hypothetical protein WJX81_006310 [Elliptochloris bilobata]|uniref:Uncharacterized protein n=1 Tax=Elliptochloris bilobata TaxID=381761 RepID=A0AAW1S2L5_9CHLO
MAGEAQSREDSLAKLKKRVEDMAVEYQRVLGCLQVDTATKEKIYRAIKYLKNQQVILDAAGQLPDAGVAKGGE